MKTLLISLLSLAFVPTNLAFAQGRSAVPDERATRVEAAQALRLQRLQEKNTESLDMARNAGRNNARTSRAMDREVVFVWNALTPEMRSMHAARELTERLSRRPEWENQNRAQRVASVSEFITNYPAIRTARRQKAMDTAIQTAETEYPAKTVALAVISLAEAPQLPGFHPTAEPNALAESARVQEVTEFPETEVPDAFTINRRFNWASPHGQWMNQMLKDIDAAKQAGDTETYEALKKRYTTWAERYLRKER